MTLNAANVRVAVTGAIYKAPIGTALLKDAKASVAAAYKDAGYVSEDGVTQSISADTTQIKAWQNGANVRTIQTSSDVTFQFTMIETTDVTLSTYYADPTASATAVKITGAQPGHDVWLLDVKDGDSTIRIVVPDGQVTERGDISYKTDEAIGYDVTITAYPDADGVNAYLYMDDGQAAGGSSS